MNLLPSPILAAADMGEVIFVIVALVIGFINWLINLWKQKQEEGERAKHVPTEEEVEARRRAWEEQTRRVEGEAAREHERDYAPAPSAPPQTGGSLKELFEELKRAAREAQSPPEPAPAPLPAPAPRPAPPPLAPAAPAYAKKVVEAPKALPPSFLRSGATDAMHTHDESARRANAAYTTREPARRGAHPLTALLHSAEGYRQAFVLKEILDTPKGMQNTPWEDK